MIGVVDDTFADHDGDRRSDRRRQRRLDVGAVLVALPAVGLVGDAEMPGRAVVAAERPGRVQRPHERLEPGLDGLLPRVGNRHAGRRRGRARRCRRRPPRPPVSGRRCAPGPALAASAPSRRRSSTATLRPPAEHRPSGAGIDRCRARRCADRLPPRHRRPSSPARAVRAAPGARRGRRRRRRW